MLFSFDMQFFTKLSLAAAAAASILGAIAVPMNATLETRAAAQVITQCTQPNTVALTYVLSLGLQNQADELW